MTFRSRSVFEHAVADGRVLRRALPSAVPSTNAAVMTVSDMNFRIVRLECSRCRYGVVGYGVVIALSPRTKGPAMVLERAALVLDVLRDIGTP